MSLLGGVGGVAHSSQKHIFVFYAWSSFCVRLIICLLQNADQCLGSPFDSRFRYTFLFLFLFNK